MRSISPLHAAPRARANRPALLLAALLCLAPAAAAAQPQDAPAPAAEQPDVPQDAPQQPASSLPARSTVLHVPPSQAAAGQDLRIVAAVDAAWTEASLLLRYRPAGSDAAYAESPFERSSAGGYHATVPAAAVRRPGIEYYIAGTLPEGDETVHFASQHAPHRVIVDWTPEERWTQLERQRLNGRLGSVSTTVHGHNFGNRYRRDDFYARGELEWTYRLLGRLYAISVGYGMIEGRTPNNRTAMAESEKQGARYGYGSVRLRLHPSAWLDGRAALGVSREGFIAGVGAALTLGKPWRSNVSFGGEILQEMGPSAWFRLTWDTVPPFLMSAAVVKTDLPAAALENGSYLVYEIRYPASPRLTLQGSLSFGSRDGPGNFGGGLGAALAF